jgi:hypothetical protein
MSERADYEVGYKKPPRHSQFKSGNRANPRGRGKRKRRTEAEIVHEIMTQSVTFVEGGKSKRVPRIKLMIKSLGAAALKGEVGALPKRCSRSARISQKIAPSNRSFQFFPKVLGRLSKHKQT